MGKFAIKSSSRYDEDIKNAPLDKDGNPVNVNSRAPIRKFIRTPKIEENKSLFLRFIGDPLNVWMHNFKKKVGDIAPANHINRGNSAPCLESWGESCPICEELKKFTHLGAEDKNGPNGAFATLWLSMHGRYSPDGSENVVWNVDRLFNVVDLDKFDDIEDAGFKPGSPSGPEIDIFCASKAQYEQIWKLSVLWKHKVWDWDLGVPLVARMEPSTTGGSIDVVRFSIEGAVEKTERGKKFLDLTEAKAKDWGIPSDWEDMPGWINVDPDVDENEEVKNAVQNLYWNIEPGQYVHFAKELNAVFSGDGPVGSSSYEESPNEKKEEEPTQRRTTGRGRDSSEKASEPEPERENHKSNAEPSRTRSTGRGRDRSAKVEEKIEKIEEVEESKEDAPLERDTSKSKEPPWKRDRSDDRKVEKLP